MTQLSTRVFVYAGHHIATTNYGKSIETLKGPYGTSVELHYSLFQNIHTSKNYFENVQYLFGEHLMDTLSDTKPKKTILVLPAGAATNFDNVFSLQEIEKIKTCVMQGMQLYATCGSAYWLAENRIWNHTSTKGKVGIFSGTAIGPLFPCFESTHSNAFLHQATVLQTMHTEVCVLISGGGTFLAKEGLAEQSMKTLATYKKTVLDQHEKTSPWENAVISCSYGEGKAILSMVHPEEKLDDTAVIGLHHLFPHRTENWQAIRDALSSEEKRLDFIVELLKELNQVENT